MNTSAPTAPRCLWCGENHPTEMIRLWGDLATTCPRLGAHEAVMLQRVTPVGFDMCELPEQPTPEPVAMARAPDGSPVVAMAPAGLEVRAFGVEEAIRVVDIDERGFPRRQEYLGKFPEKP